MSKLINTFFLLFPVIMLSQIFPKKGHEIGNLIPENYKLKNLLMGDLNGDNHNDLVLVIKNIRTNKKSIAIYYIIEPYEWVLHSESENFFSYKKGDIFSPELTTYETFNDRNKYEESVSIEIKGKDIIISTSDGYGNAIKTSFRPNKNGAYEIIGGEINRYSRNVENNTSINYLTSKMKVTSTEFGGPSDGESIDEEWFKILNLKKNSFIDFNIKQFLFEKDEFNLKKINN